MASRWYQKYQDADENAVTDLVNCVLLAAGCDQKVTEDDIRDPDNIQGRLSELQDVYQDVSFMRLPWSAHKTDLDTATNHRLSPSEGEREQSLPRFAHRVLQISHYRSTRDRCPV